MVIENQNRQYGGMAFDNVYQHNMPHHSPPHFTDPWAAAHTSSHPNPPMYATSMPANHLGLNPVKQEEVGRPTAISMPYPSISVSAPSMVPGSNYSTTGYEAPDMLGLQHGIPRTTFEQAPTYPTTSSINSYPPANYAPLNYTQSLHPQHHEARRVSHP